MAIKRSQNWVDQQRVDVPHMRSIESAIRSDFDDLLNGFVTGIGHSHVVNGFELNMTGAIGSSSSALQVIVAEGSVFHGTSDVAGTFLVVPALTPNETLSSTTNTKVSGSFTPGALNYIGIEFTRTVDNSTTSQVYFWNPTSASEFTKTVPLAETLNYQFVITSSIFAANVLPLAVVETDASNNVLRVEDRRPLLFRLGTAGSSAPNPTYVYPWNHQAEGRVENPSSSNSSSTSPFRGGDKQIQNLKEWMDAVMSAFKEIKGTTYWYSANTGGSIVKLRSDLANLMLTGKGNISHSASVAGRINWSQDMFLNLIGSRLSFKIIANPSSTDITLADDQVAYMNFVRGAAITPNLIFVNGSSVVSSVGAVSWTNNVLAGDYIKDAAQDDTKYYKIQSVDTASQVTLTEVFGETSTGASGIPAQYAWGTYQTNPVPSTNRHIRVVNRKDVPSTEDVYWLFLREDNGGSIARVYVRGGGGGGELEQGESKEVSDGTSEEVLEYIGSPSESAFAPDYTNANGGTTTEQFTITFPAASAITSGQAFVAYSSKDVTKHAFWFNKNAAGGDPLIVGAIEHPIAIVTGNPATTVAAAATTVINATGYFNAVDNLNGTVTVTLSQSGSATDAQNINVGGLSIVINTQGTGAPNNYITDGDNLTKAIKELDSQLGDFVAASTEEGYEESLTVVSGSPSSDNEINGPVVVSTNITIPLNSRDFNVQQSYTVGAGTLAVYLNGVRLLVNSDYVEVGSAGDASTQINNSVEFEVDDVLVFKIEGQGVGAGGGASTYTAVNLGSTSSANVYKQTAGTQFQFRRLTQGSNITITENADNIVISSSAGVAASSGNVYIANHTMLSTDDMALADTSSNDVTFTLPDATSVPGHIYYFKKITSANTMFIKSIMGQVLDYVDIDAAPLAITVQMEAVTISSVAGSWWIF